MATLHRILTTLIAAATLAGCLSATDTDEDPDQARGGPITSELDPRLSQLLFDEMIVEHEPVPASLDGVLLDSWVFRPKTPADVTVPVFINFSPYWANLAPAAATGGDAFSQHMIDYFVPRGYAVVLSSARGTGFSQGCFNMGGDIEQQDAYDVVEHFAAKEWSNGAVGAGGKSYDGTIPNGVLVKAPPSLRTIFPVSGISELYKYNSKGGIAYTQGPIFNTYYYALVGIANADPNDPTTVALIADDIACVTLPENQAHGLGSGATGDYTDYWVERNYSAEAPGVGTNVSVFFVHGLQDWNVKPDHILPFLTELKAEGVPVKAWLHQWTVGGGDGHVYPMRQDWNLTMLRWLDHWLKGKDTGIMDEPLVQVQDDQDMWRHEDYWPPERATAFRFFLAPDGLSTEAPEGESTYTYRDSEAAGSPTELRVTSEPLAEDLRFAGEPRVRVTVASDRAAGHMIAEIYSVAPDGEWDLVTWGGLNLRHRQALEEPQPVVPGVSYDLSFPLHPQDSVIPAGHSVGIRLAADGGGYVTAPSGAEYSVQLDGSAFVELPRIVDGLRWEEPQPVEIVCFAC